jgi:D-apionolactonase
MISRAVKLYGTEAVDEPTRTLTAGSLSVELDNGALRYVRIGGIEVIRAIAFLVRDENWGTYAPSIVGLEVGEQPDRFSVVYRAECGDGNGRLAYHARIDGKADGSLDFEVVAEPATDFRTNRTGFVVLHPVEGVAGQTVKVLHVDGGEEESSFPAEIDPMCPFQEIRALSHEIAPGVWATCTMEGDAFEMEDQRNWSDASYKTYVRPLARPWPYTLPKGERFDQAVRLSVSGKLPAAAANEAREPVEVQLGGIIGRLPAVGLGVPADEAAHALGNAALIQRLGPKWLLCQVDLRDGRGLQELGRYKSLGELTGAEIVLEIVTSGGLDPDSELNELAATVARAGLSPAAVAVFPAQDLKSVLPGSPGPVMPSFEEIYVAARKAFPEARLGGGMATYFTELNRKRPPAGLLDYVTHCTCPNVHAPDDRSVMETMEALPYQILSTRAFMGATIEYRIGPSHLGCRENPYGKSTAPNPGNGRVCLSRIDPRQRGLFNAAWSLSYVANFARGGISAIALGAPTGPFGHISRKTDFVQPYFDALSDVAVYPGYHVMAGLTRLAGAPLLSTRLSRKGAVDALAVQDGGKTVLWLANLTPSTVEVSLLPGNSGGVRITILDADSFERMTTAPDYLDSAARDLDKGTVSLDAYAVARIETGAGT